MCKIYYYVCICVRLINKMHQIRVISFLKICNIISSTEQPCAVVTESLNQILDFGKDP